ncbi:hypothetical protein PO909_033025, partial [Leuciscus waleckii]
PEEFEAVHSHTFRLKTFKKGKHCGVCKQTVNNEGLICRGQSRGGWTACGVSCTRDICPSQHLMRVNGKRFSQKGMSDSIRGSLEVKAWFMFEVYALMSGSSPSSGLFLI